MLQVAGSHEAVNVGELAALHLAGSCTGEGLNRDHVAFCDDVARPVADIGYRLPRMEDVSFDAVTREIDNRPEAVRLDCPLYGGANQARRHVRPDDLNSGLERDLGGLDQICPAARADFHSLGGVGDVAIDVGTEVDLHHLPPFEPELIIMRRGVVSRHIVDADANGEGGFGSHLSHSVLDRLCDVEQVGAVLGYAHAELERL